MTWSIKAAAAEFGCSRETLRRGLIRNGVDVKPGRRYATPKVLAALFGDLKVERTREARARADKLELDRRHAEGELVSLAEVVALLTPMFHPIRQRLNELPAAMANQCNPTDPMLARGALQRWVDESLPLIREILKTDGK